VEAIRDALIETDPDGRRTYERNARAARSCTRALDDEIKRCMQRVPADTRKLVTTHDALGYYADRYGLDVVCLRIGTCRERPGDLK
jgi:ABC-type Zn uptake system ZnuABC Zn-binding protein ZnuA